jgi:hypothetical protein
MALVELELAKQVLSADEECDTYIPPLDKDFNVQEFYGEAAYSTNSAVKLVWDLDGANEEILWATKGSGGMPNIDIIRTGDGVKKLALCLDNGEADPIFMSGHALIAVED